MEKRSNELTVNEVDVATRVRSASGDQILEFLLERPDLSVLEALSQAGRDLFELKRSAVHLANYLRSSRLSENKKLNTLIVCIDGALEDFDSIQEVQDGTVSAARKDCLIAAAQILSEVESPDTSCTNAQLLRLSLDFARAKTKAWLDLAGLGSPHQRSIRH